MVKLNKELGIKENLFNHKSEVNEFCIFFYKFFNFSANSKLINFKHDCDSSIKAKFMKYEFINIILYI